MTQYHLIFAGILLVTAIILSIKYRKLAFFAYVLLVPFMHKEEFSLGYWDLLPIRIVGGGIIIGYSYLFLKWYLSKDKTKEQKHLEIKNFILGDYFLILILFLWLVRGLSIFFTGSDLFHSLALYAFFTSIVFIYLIFRYLLLNYGNKFYKTAFILFIGTGIFASIYAFIQYYLRICCRKSIGGVWVIPGNEPRLGSTFWDVNHFGGFLIALIPITIGVFFAAKKTYIKIMAIGLTGLFSFFLLMTQSRSSWIGLAVGMFIALIISYGSKMKKPLIFAVIAGVVGISSILVYTNYKNISIQQRIDDYMHFRLDSTDTHIMLLEGAAEIFFDKFYLGAGYGNFDEAFRETATANNYFDREPVLRTMRVPPHSIWGETLAETGALGITFYALFCIILLGSIVFAINRQKSKSYKYIGVGLLGSISSLFVAGLFYSYNLEFFWIIVFLSIGYIYLTLKEDYNIQSVAKFWYQNKVTPYLIIIPPAIFYIFIRLGTVSLVDWDEAIYAKVAKNIYESGEWLSLKWVEMEKYWFEKPPLYMWLTSLAYNLTGVNALGARIVSAIAGVLTIITVYKLGNRLYNKFTGIVSALILLSTVQFLYYSRNGMLDVTVTFFITLSLALFYFGLQKDEKIQRNNYLYFVLSGVFVGLAVMTKAVVGLLPLGVMVMYLFYLKNSHKNKFPLKEMALLLGSLAVVALPWHLYSYLIHGSPFIDKYFLNHMLDRGLRGLGHEKPIWWYLEVIKVSFRIWIFPLIAGLIFIPLLDKKNRKQFMFLLIGFLVMFIFFSISTDKLQWYIMPVYPLLAIISARFMDLFLITANRFLKHEFKYDFQMLRVFAILAIFLLTVFYIVTVRGMVYHDDPNEDKVALVIINNDTYPKDKYPDRKLYFSRPITPALMFYSDHQLSTADEQKIIEIINQSKPDESNDFLVNQDIFYNLRNVQGIYGEPLALDVKGSAGGWVLFKSVSRVEVLNERLSKAKLVRDPIFGKVLKNLPITPEEEKLLQETDAYIKTLIDELAVYGYYTK